MEISQIALRLKSLIQALGLSDSQFADQCEISRATLSLLLSGKNKKISDVLLSQIHEAFPQVSITWLLFDEGNMFINQEVADHIEENTSEKRNENEIFPSDYTAPHEDLNLIPLNKLDESIKTTINKAFETYINSDSNPFKKLLTQSGKRKVSQIMVYYEDSTFETFVPDGFTHS